MNIIELAVAAQLIDHRDTAESLPADFVQSLNEFAHLVRAAALAEPAKQEPVALKSGQYIIRYNEDGEFGQKTGWLYRDGGSPCVITGKPVYVWRPLSDLIAPQPAKREPLTREQALAIVQSNPDTMTAIRMTEAAHGITKEKT